MTQTPESATNPYAPPQAVVLDVLNPADGTVLAERATRLGASILDGLLLGVMVYLPLIVGGAVTGAARGSNAVAAAVAVGVVLAIVGFVAWLWLNLKYMKENGQSIGKKACGIKVVRTDGSRASLSRLVWLRNVVNGLLGLIPLYGLIDALFIFGSARRCLHDYIADTIVIKA